MVSSVVIVLSCVLAFCPFLQGSLLRTSSELQQPSRAIEKYSHPDAFLATNGGRPLSPSVVFVAFTNDRLLQTPSCISYAEREESIFHLTSQCRQPIFGRAPPQSKL